MLPEIFNSIGENIFIYFAEKEIKLKNSKILPDLAWKTKHLRIELMRFGHQAISKNFQHGSVPDKALYAFTFFIIADIPDYSDCLQFTELICDYFDKRPFIQLKITEKEFEVAVSSLELTMEELNQFWMAQKQPHQPILFYQARISEI
ncbi:MAG: hypothetical protein ACXWCG_02365 [Flavitalea sp.]